MVETFKNDKIFLKTVEESTTKSSDHYVVPLPFKKDNQIMPNNMKRAMQRLMYLKRRFKEYARRTDDSPVGRLRYIPYHDVCIT